jgi:hypothetical protein
MLPENKKRIYKVTRLSLPKHCYIEKNGFADVSCTRS